eukprot:s3895_g4.t1
MLPPRKKRTLLALEAPSAGSADAVPAKKPAALAALDPPLQEEQKADSPKAAEVSEKAQPKVQEKGVEDMANEILQVLGEPKPKVPKAPKAKAAKVPKAKKKAAAPEKKEAEPKKQKGLFNFQEKVLETQSATPM